MTMTQTTLSSPRSLSHRARRRPARELGMTLVEIMIVVIIMALIATAVGVAVIPRLNSARVQATQADAATIRSAVEQFTMENPGQGCPSMDDLVGDFLSSSNRTKDAWENDFSIECDGQNITVSSAGPDGQMGTEDDIH